METTTQENPATKTFAQDVGEGLSAFHKYLPSKYFYDAKGDKLFQQIMQAPEYYLTGCEFEIFEQQAAQLLARIKEKGAFNLVELGAGDGYKTKLLLNDLISQNTDFKYYPIDISKDVLAHLATDLKQAYPNLQVQTLNYEYFTALEKLNELDQKPKLILFLGGNIGNFKTEVATSFFTQLQEKMLAGDYLLSGIDLKKKPETIIAAYNDKAGVTRDFNLNLLERINTELGGNFDLSTFKHHPTYNPHNGEARSYLLSTKEQTVEVKALNKHFHFEAFEAIHTEISKKYNLKEIENLANRTGFKIVEHFTDSKNYFVNTLWQKP
jgi:L-histidine N-alpha-methyltransferase